MHPRGCIVDTGWSESFYQLQIALANLRCILGLAGSVMNSCLGHKHVDTECTFWLKTKIDQNRLVRSNTKTLCFSIVRCLLTTCIGCPTRCLNRSWMPRVMLLKHRLKLRKLSLGTVSEVSRHQRSWHLLHQLCGGAG